MNTLDKRAVTTSGGMTQRHADFQSTAALSRASAVVPAVVGIHSGEQGNRVGFLRIGSGLRVSSGRLTTHGLGTLEVLQRRKMASSKSMYAIPSSSREIAAVALTEIWLGKKTHSRTCG